MIDRRHNPTPSRKIIRHPIQSIERTSASMRKKQEGKFLGGENQWRIALSREILENFSRGDGFLCLINLHRIPHSANKHLF